MLAQAHFELQRGQEPSLSFEDCYIYGTSTANQRIEAWWMQFTKGLTFRWRVGFVRRIFLPILTLYRTTFLSLPSKANSQEISSQTELLFSQSIFPFFGTNFQASYDYGITIEFDLKRIDQMQSQESHLFSILHQLMGLLITPFLSISSSFVRCSKK